MELWFFGFINVLVEMLNEFIRFEFMDLYLLGSVYYFGNSFGCSQWFAILIFCDKYKILIS